MSDSSAHQIGLLLPCMDRKLDYEVIDLQLRQKFTLRPQAEGEWLSGKYFYVLSSPGGSLPVMVPQALTAFAENGVKNGSQYELTHVVFATHTTCAAGAVGVDQKPDEAAKWLVGFYKMMQEKYPDQLVGQPKLYKTEIDTKYSWVGELVEIDEVWTAAAPFNPTEQGKQILEILKLT